MAKPKRKSRSAVELGRRGGLQRRKNLTAEQRTESARIAAKARWAKVALDKA